MGQTASALKFVSFLALKIRYPVCKFEFVSRNAHHVGSARAVASRVYIELATTACPFGDRTCTELFSFTTFSLSCVAGPSSRLDPLTLIRDGLILDHKINDLRLFCSFLAHAV
jgi:hypothetical protein